MKPRLKKKKKKHDRHCIPPKSCGSRDFFPYAIAVVFANVRKLQVFTIQ